ncbi:hypothetical protein DXG01_016070, partial [Tephrocybe rancida]
DNPEQGRKGQTLGGGEPRGASSTPTPLTPLTPTAAPQQQPPHHHDWKPTASPTSNTAPPEGTGAARTPTAGRKAHTPTE